MKKYVVFDFDGTIVDSRSQFIKAFNEVARKFSFREMRVDELDYFSSMSVKVSFTQRYRMLGIPLYKLPIAIIKAPRAAKQIRENLKKGISNLREFDGMREVLLKLKESGYKLAIISTNSASNIEEFLKKNNLEVFERIFSSKGLFGKDYTIKKFLSKMKIEKEEMIYVGDELRDIVACKKTGVDIISVSWGYNSQDTLQQGHPQFIAFRPEQLTEIVDGTLIYA